jgi:hypothetical protein
MICNVLDVETSSLLTDCFNNKINIDVIDSRGTGILFFGNSETCHWHTTDLLRSAFYFQTFLLTSSRSRSFIS